MIRILFIDDDPAFVEEMKFPLEEKGFNVTTAHDGQEAFRIARSKEFDLVITDVLMIKSHGMEVILHMRVRDDGVGIQEKEQLCYLRPDSLLWTWQRMQRKPWHSALTVPASLIKGT